MTTAKIKNIAELEKKIDLDFTNKDLLTLAFVHKSFINEHTEEKAYNERLEFLGDAVLELAVTQFLYHHFPEQPEGQLTNWRSALVKGKNLAKVSRSLGLGEFLLLSRGEDLSKGREKEYILANTCEALIGAIFLDKGFEVANEFILKHIVVMLDDIIAKGLNVDAKSRVQELSQDKFNVTPTYELLREDGPDHDKKFVMGIYFGKKLAGEGEGPSKQDAEQAAAKDAMAKEGWN
jgi:ribonuclease-3